mmetsp:Transcript_9661/g.24613  ORF Transcript_9661/g.24613 Transcript_9661/m.24613 type:complete len:106 (+) Transcript_9661:1304-1621(+)
MYTRRLLCVSVCALAGGEGGIMVCSPVRAQVLLSRCFLVGLLEKRNDILARSVRDACLEAPLGTTVVAVLGAAHLNGIQARLLTEDPLEGVVPGVKAADADMGTI